MAFTNKYPGFCVECHVRVREGEGMTEKNAAGRYVVFCMEHAPQAAPRHAPDPIIADRFLPLAHGVVPYAHQDAGIEWIKQRGRKGGILADDMGLGKGQPVDAKILTPAGWCRIGDLVVGDKVIGSKGTPVPVTGVYPRGVLQVYRVSFNDGTSVVVDGDHLWAVRSATQKARGRGFGVAQTRNLIGDLQDKAGNNRWQIPMVEPVRFAGASLPLDPYLLGVLLGDGSLTQNTPTFTPGDDKVPAEVRKVLPEGTTLVEHSSENRATSWSLVGERHNVVQAALRQMKLDGLLSHEKFVPDAYLFADADQRLALLQGLIDTDGEIRKDAVVFCSTSENLAAAVSLLAQSLGGVARRGVRLEPFYRDASGEKKIGRPAFTVNIKLPAYLCPARAHASRYSPPSKYAPTRAMVSIEEAGHAEVVCIAVDSPDHLYVTEHFIVTHNTMQMLSSIPADADGVRYPTIILCPAVAKAVWKREAARFAPDLQVTCLAGKDSFRWPVNGEAVVTNFDILPRTVEGDNGFPALPAALLSTLPEKVVLVMDEAHKVKNWSSQRTKAARAIAFACRKKNGRVWLLTGTPLTNDPSETYSLLVAAGLQFETFKGDKEGAMALAGGYRGRYGGWEFHGEIKPEFAERLKKVMLRRRKNDVLNLPPKRYETLSVNVGKVREADLVLDALKGKGIDLTAVDMGVLQSGVTFETMSRAREALARAKTQAAMELAKSIVEDGEQVIVFSAHLAPVEACGTLEGFAVITGDTPNDERSRIEADFQAGRIRGVAATIKAAGVALTLTAASRVIFVDQAWTPADNEQAEDRAYRIGQNKSVLITTLVADHELDERIETLLAEKRRLIHGTIEAARAAKGETRVVPAPVVEAPVAKPAPAPVVEDDFADLPF